MFIPDGDEKMTVRLAIIGFGAITEEIVRTLEERNELAMLVAVLVRAERLAEAKRRAAGRFAVVDSLDGLCGFQPTMVAECAGHGAMRQFGPEVLERGVDLLCSSVGALADEAFEAEIAAAAAGRARLWIPSGAIAGIDGLLAARTAGLRSVTYTSVKPPAAWSGTAGEKMLAGPARDRRTALFSGTAREAAIAYPQNVNVGATVALAGLGLDRTMVSLVSDPAASGPLGVIEASGDFGTFRFEILAYASPRNPKTSLLTAHSIIAAVQAGVCFASFPAAPAARAPSGRPPRTR
jgi:aspartate dehydrogenase